MNEQEINEKIHVEIMGKCVHDPVRNAADEGVWLWDCNKCNASLGVPDSIPNYCQNISDAFLVVEKLPERFQLEVRREIGRYQVLLYLIKIPIFRGDWRSFEQLPKELCHAALKTLENR